MTVRPDDDELGELHVEERFATLPEWVLFAAVSDRAVRLYAVLQRFGNASGVRMPGRAALAKAMHCSVRSVDRAREELEDIKALRVESAGRPRRGHRLGTNRYFLRTSDPRGRATADGSPVRPAMDTGGNPRTARNGTIATGDRSDSVAAIATGDDQPKVGVTPPPEGVEGEVHSRLDIAELAAECRVRRRDLGLPFGRWTTSNVRRAIQRALADGRNPAEIRPALIAIADDPATATPGRLPHDGPWWDAADLERRRRRRQEQLAARGDAQDCQRCDAGGWELDVEPARRCTHTPAEETA